MLVSEKSTTLITNQTMPAMTGLELVEKIRKIRSDLPVILCTGFSKYIQDRTHENTGILEIVYKPFTGQELVTLIRKVLDEVNQKSRQSGGEQ